MSQYLKSFPVYTYFSKLLAVPVFLLVFNITAYAANGGATAPLTHLLNLYYDIKDALVNSDGAAASKNAVEMLNVIKSIDAKNLGAAEQTAFAPLQDKLNADIKQIAATQDIAAQRKNFSSLSQNMYTLAKAVKISADPVYQDYCPMQQAYWLSKEKTIKNPYYGSQMLSCGKVVTTIQ
ncbi:MAG TPA: DUF3347 domain-containing protein [Chitinophagaceae bacterium]|nr:DUF3347 domain-containing protein [Chitinophagaceae bacterium]